LVLINHTLNIQAHTIVTKENAVFEDMAVKYFGPSDCGYKY